MHGAEVSPDQLSTFLNNPSAETRFIENLPPGNPAMSLKEGISEAAIKDISKVCEGSALEYFRMLQWLSPIDRTRVFKATDLEMLLQSIRNAPSDAQESALAQAAAGALGEENLHSFILAITNPTDKTGEISEFVVKSWARPEAAMILARGLPLQDVVGFFGQYCNLAVSRVEDPNTLLDLKWLTYFNMGIQTLDHCVEKDIREHPEVETLQVIRKKELELSQTRRTYGLRAPTVQYPPEVEQRGILLHEIVRDDLTPFLDKALKVPGVRSMMQEERAKGGDPILLSHASFLRENMFPVINGENNALDKLMGKAGYTWDEQGKRYNYTLKI